MNFHVQLGMFVSQFSAFIFACSFQFDLTCKDGQPSQPDAFFRLSHFDGSDRVCPHNFQVRWGQAGLRGVQVLLFQLQ